MKEVIIKYSNPKTLDVLKSFAKYFDFSISSVKQHKDNKKEKIEYINGVPFSPGDSSIDISELSEIFSGKGIDAKQLRAKGWQRKG